MPWGNGMPTGNEQIAELERQIAALRALQAQSSAPVSQGGLLSRPPMQQPPMQQPPMQPPMQQPTSMQQPPMQRPPMAAGGIPPTGPPVPGGSLRQIYGLLAKYADDPASVGNQYVQAALEKQRIDAARKANDDPTTNFAKLWSPIPIDQLTPESSAAIQKKQKEEGWIDLSLIKWREKLSPVEQTLIGNANEEAGKSEIRIGRMMGIAQKYDQFAKQGIAKGLAGNVREWFKTNIAGSEDEITRTLAEFDQIKNSAALLNLPRGPASDKDIVFALKGWANATANPEYLGSFLRGMSKLAAIENVRLAHTAAYLSQNMTQQGQYESWEQNKDRLIADALQRLNLDTPNENDRGAPQPFRGTPGQPGTGTGQKRSVKDIMEGR
jgi:hypothetical protein